MALHLAGVLEAREALYEALDCSAMSVSGTRSAGERAGGYADIGWSADLGWHESFRLLAAVPSGVSSSSSFGAVSPADQLSAEAYFVARAKPNPRLLSVGSSFSGPYATVVRVSREPKIIGGGSIATEQHGLSAHPDTMPAKYGPSA